MTLSRNLWTNTDVREIADRVKSIIKKELVTMEYSTEGNSFRKQFAVPLNELLQACDDYLNLYGTDDQRQPDASFTRPFIVG